MRLRTEVILLATVVIALALGSCSSEEVRAPPVKLDKNLRRALLKALADLDTESAEQKSFPEARESRLGDSDLLASSEPAGEQGPKTLESLRGSIFSFDGFPSEEETPSEDKLQNTTFVETDQYDAGSDVFAPRPTTTQKPRDDNTKAFQTHDVVLTDKSSAIYEKSLEPVNDQLETRSVKSSSSGSTINVIDSSNAKPTSKFSESLVMSSSNGIATANALISPKPTVSSPTVKTKSNSSTSSSSSVSSTSISDAAAKKKKEDQEVKIFQAPLVAAFTVQQDERGVAKSVVPIYNQNGDGQALTLQEQLDFKQKLLERQLAELQAQQIQQTQFLVRQQQIYEQQLRQKQQQELYLQEQSRFKQVQESERARLKQIEEQRVYQLQQQQQQQQQQKQSQQFNLNQQNGLLSLQPPLKTPNVSFQPSLALELPKPALPPTFQTSFHDQLRIQQLQRQQQQQAQLHQQQQLQLQRQQQLLQQQRLQQSFASFPTDFQPPASNPAQRFHRQEALGTVGNFGFNDNNRQQTSRNQFTFNNQQSRGPQTFNYNPYQTQQQLQQQYQQQQHFRPQRPQTPAKQIQHLLYQSGVVGDLGTVQGTGGQEDLNIVSKVLALNVGAAPTKNNRYNNNNFANSGNVA